MQHLSCCGNTWWPIVCQRPMYLVLGGRSRGRGGECAPGWWVLQWGITCKWGNEHRYLIDPYLCLLNDRRMSEDSCSPHEVWPWVDSLLTYDATSINLDFGFINSIQLINTQKQCHIPKPVMFCTSSKQIFKRGVMMRTGCTLVHKISWKARGALIKETHKPENAASSTLCSAKRTRLGSIWSMCNYVQTCSQLLLNLYWNLFRIVQVSRSKEHCKAVWMYLVLCCSQSWLFMESGASRPWSPLDRFHLRKISDTVRDSAPVPTRKIKLEWKSSDVYMFDMPG